MPLLKTAPHLFIFFFLMIRRPPRSPFFPYPPFFRSNNYFSVRLQGEGGKSVEVGMELLVKTSVLENPGDQVPGSAVERFKTAGDQELAVALAKHPEIGRAHV